MKVEIAGKGGGKEEGGMYKFTWALLGDSVGLGGPPVVVALTREVLDRRRVRVVSVRTGLGVGKCMAGVGYGLSGLGFGLN